MRIGDRKIGDGTPCFIVAEAGTWSGFEDAILAELAERQIPTIAVFNKVDLAQPMGVDVRKLEADAKRINPNARVAATNCRSGEGVGEVIEALGL